MQNVILSPTTPQFLTEQMFVNMGFFTGSANHFQILAAFSIAENQIAREIGTFIFPTTFTGTFTYGGMGIDYTAPVGKIISVNSITFNEVYTNGVERLVSGTAWVTDMEDGFFTVQRSVLDNSNCNGCYGNTSGFYKFNASITAGYASGTASADPLVQLASCMAADIVLKMMYDEGIGVVYENLVRTLQVGRVIQSFDTKGLLGQTIFGPSSRGHYISNLLNGYKIGRAGRL